MFIVIVVSLLLAICIPFICSYIRHLLSLKYYPDGPFPLPVIGNMHQLNEKPQEVFRDMAKKYGSVFSLSFGMNRIVIVNTIEPAKEALVTKSHIFSGRPTNSYTVNLLSGLNTIVFGDYDPVWVYVKKLAHSVLRVYGENKFVSSTLVTESEKLLLRLKKSEGKPTDLKCEFGLSALNVITSIVFGEQYEQGDKDFVEIYELTEIFFRTFEHGDPVAYLPWLQFFPLKSLSVLKKFLIRRNLYFHKKIQDHVKTYDVNNIRDFTDAMIQKVHEEAENNTNRLNYEKIELIAFDLLLASLETTSSTLGMMMVYLIHWPELQEEMYKEILEAVGKDAYPTYTDRSRLHLVRAFIYEAQRFASLTPLGVPHKAMEDSSINGKSIPKETQVIINFWNIHHDDRHWDKPFEFDPKRWLDDQGKFSPGQNVSYLPFSAGKRVCLGESVAKTALFVLLARFIKEFRVERNPDETFPKLEPSPGVTLSPFPFTAIVKSRIS